MLYNFPVGINIMKNLLSTLLARILFTLSISVFSTMNVQEDYEEQMI